jgi:hypothetical protein
MTPDIRRPGSAGRVGSADHPARLLWAAGITTAALSTAAFALWIRDGAGILMDMMLVFCL